MFELIEISIAQNLGYLGLRSIDCQHDVRVFKFRNLVMFTFVTDLVGSMCNVGLMSYMLSLVLYSFIYILAEFCHYFVSKLYGHSCP